MANVRIPAATYDRLSLLAAEHGLSRPKMIDRLLERGPSPVDVAPDRALELLAESAEAGSIPARIAYARITAKATTDAPAVHDELDALRESRHG